MGPLPPSPSGNSEPGSLSSGNLLRISFLTATYLLLLPASAPALQEEPINFYRYVLDIEPPESPALVALDAAPTHAFRATAPKPVATNFLVELNEEGAAVPTASLEASPYFLAGGGIRTAEQWRSGSLGGRLMRVLTKTVLSVGGGPDPLDDNALRGAVALRSTLHDTHDPIGNTRAPERMQAALARLDGGPPPLSEESVAGLSPEIGDLLADAARQMRAREDWLVSAGLGLSGTLQSGALEPDSLPAGDWTLWLNWQYTFGPRFDLLATARALRLFGDDRDLRLAAGLQRKTAHADFLAEVFFDTADDRIHGGLAAEAHLAPGLRAVTSLTTEPERDEETYVRHLRVRTMLRWYMAEGSK